MLCGATCFEECGCGKNLTELTVLVLCSRRRPFSKRMLHLFVAGEVARIGFHYSSLNLFNLIVVQSLLHPMVFQETPQFALSIPCCAIPSPELLADWAPAASIVLALSITSITSFRRRSARSG